MAAPVKFAALVLSKFHRGGSKNFLIDAITLEAVRPSQNSISLEAVGLVARTVSTCFSSSSMLHRRFVPLVTVMGRSVLGRSVIQGRDFHEVGPRGCD